MHHITMDKGMTWSRLCWPVISDKVPSLLIQGLHFIPETMLSSLEPFYAGMIHSYIMVNNLFYENKRNKQNKDLHLPINLWGHPHSKKINYDFTNIGYFTVADLPWCAQKIDFCKT